MHPHFRSPILLAACLVCVTACATSPTGRRQLMLVSDAQMTTLGIQAFDEIRKEKPIETDRAINRYVRCVATAVTAEVDGDWEVVVFRDDSANAFALPGRKIGVHTGILKVANTSDQLAAVIGHEVGHVLARHSHERMSNAIAAQTGLAAAGVAVGDMDNGQQAAILGALGVGMQVGVLLPYNRTQENEGDVIGLDLMARAGFDPREAVTLWQNMAKAGNAAPPEFLSTHPAHETRIAQMRARLPEAMRTYRAARHAGKRPSCPVP